MAKSARSWRFLEDDRKRPLRTIASPGAMKSSGRALTSSPTDAATPFGLALKPLMRTLQLRLEQALNGAIRPSRRSAWNACFGVGSGTSPAAVEVPFPPRPCEKAMFKAYAEARLGFLVAV